MRHRITCPSCSATLTTKGEPTGRAVKCPKCGGVIPASASEAIHDDEPARPAARAADDEDDRPRRRPRGDDRDDDRPARPRRMRDEEDRPGGKKPGRSNTPLILALVGGGFLLLSCCGGGGIGVYWFVGRVNDAVDKVQKEPKSAGSRVTQANYNELKVGTTTRKGAEEKLGNGKMVASADLDAIFPADAQSVNRWKPLAVRGRAVAWQDGDDYVLAAFYPDAHGDALLQMKQWLPRAGASVFEGEPNDVSFANAHKPKTPDKVVTPRTRVRAEDLAGEFETDPAAAAARYNNKTFQVDGKLSDVKVADGNVTAILEGLPGKGGKTVSCVVKKYLNTTPFIHGRGDRVVIEGKCAGATAGGVSFTDSAFTGFEKDPTAGGVEATALVAAYRADTAAADAKFKGKQVRVKNARIEAFESDGVMIMGSSTKKGPGRKIRVLHDPSYRTLTFTPPLRVGGQITIRGLCEGVSGDQIVISGAWFTY